MFEKEYRFTGLHAKYVNQLTNKFEESEGTCIFQRNIDIFVCAPLVGFLYRRISKVDNSKDPVTDRVYDAHIMGDRMIQSHDQIMFDYQLIMLLDEEYESDQSKRMDKAFKYINKDPNDYIRFQSYLRGGIEVLYEKIIDGAVNPEDYINNLYDFVSEFQDLFNKNINNQEILQECIK